MFLIFISQKLCQPVARSDPQASQAMLPVGQQATEMNGTKNVCLNFKTALHILLWSE